MSSRQTKARLLLAVFIPLLLITSFHRHQPVEAAHTDACAYCINHLPHDGHLSSASTVLDDCVVCQLFTLNYVAPVVLVATMALMATIVSSLAPADFWPETVKGLNPGRAPPFGF